ncbi:MAG: tRNA guanosine(15) transglycosylase TgtA [Methanobacteriota archaeon]|nr:MAG: tRNA guanosine(15) transglycosylase TgtA [Euryarchaeota archaeon]
MSFEIRKWDGIAKSGIFKVGEKSINTPAIFPVVHPVFQSIKPSRLKKEFGFNQIITSAYLLKKKMDKGTSVNRIHDYLEFDGVIMMDSGAYQLMVYGDVELDQQTSMELQRKVGADIGVILDYPIGYDVSYQEAQQRVATTIERVQEAMDSMGNNDPIWTLPIQGGKFDGLIGEYIEHIGNKEVYEKFDFFALGSVVQVMINQDYPTMVKMIIAARKKLPVNKPLHLFGAGHPAMFALAVFLGCDTFDSAAYSLMAKDNRYMTSQRTYQLEELEVLPCVCPVCSSIDAKEFKSKQKDERIRLLAEHNLWITQDEIKKIHLAISRGTMWDLVWERANSVPNLGKATKLAFQLYLEDEELRKLILDGTPISKPYAIKIFRNEDLMRPEVYKVRSWIEGYLSERNIIDPIIIFLDPDKSSFRKLPESELKGLDEELVKKLVVFNPVYGMIPYGILEVFPVSQHTSELNFEEIGVNYYKEEVKAFHGHITVIRSQKWTKERIGKILGSQEFEEIVSDKPVSILKSL